MDDLLSDNKVWPEDWRQLDLFPLLALLEAKKDETPSTPDGRAAFLRADDSFALSLSQVRSFRESKSGVPNEVTTSYLSLLCPDRGTAASFDALFAENRKIGKRLIDFLHHRLLWQAYDAWKETRFAGMVPRITERLRLMFGVNRSLLNDDEFLYAAKWLLREDRSACVLEAMLAEFFRKTFRVQWDDVHESLKVSLFSLTADEEECFNPFAKDAPEHAIGTLIGLCRIFLGEGTSFLIELHWKNDIVPEGKLDTSMLDWSAYTPGERRLPVLVRPALVGREVHR